MATDYLRDAFVKYQLEATNTAEDQLSYNIFFSWYCGALVLCEGLKKVKPFKSTPNRLDKAKHLVELFMQPMISAWCENVDSQVKSSDEQKGKGRRTAFKNVQTLLDIHQEDSIELHMGFDKEFQSAKKAIDKGGLPAYYIDMFYQRFRECLTGEWFVEWSKLQFPIRSWGEFIDVCDEGKYHGDLESVVLMTQVWGVIMFSTTIMFNQLNSMGGWQET